MDDSTRREVHWLASEGLTQRAIAEQLGLSRSSVWRALQVNRSQSGRTPERDVDPGESPGWGALVGLAILLLGAFLNRKRQPPPRPAVQLRRAEAPSGGGWVVLPTGQVVWRGPR
jgi:LPXTG-motif cell wall-anchored protein